MTDNTPLTAKEYAKRKFDWFRALNFATGPNGGAGLTQLDFKVGTAIYDHHNARTGRCDPSQDTIAEEVGGCDPLTVTRSCNRLKKAGFLTWERTGGSNAYAILHDNVPAILARLAALAEARKKRRMATSEKSPDLTPASDRPEESELTPASNQPATSDASVKSDLTPASDRELTLASDKLSEGNNLKEPFEEKITWPTDFREQFWDAYPNKVGQAQAFKELEALQTSGEIEFPNLIAAVHRYADSVAEDDPKYIKHPRNWLKEKRWTDEIKPKPQEVWGSDMADTLRRAQEQEMALRGYYPQAPSTPTEEPTK